MSLLEAGTIQYGHKKINFTVCRSYRRKRTVGLVLQNADDLLVMVPATAKAEEIWGVLQRSSKLILKRVAKQKFSQTPPQSGDYVSGKAVQYLGKNYRLKLNQVALKSGCKLKDGWLLVDVKVSQRSEVERLIRCWFYTQAEKYLAKRVAYWSNKLKIKSSGKILVTNPKKRWASCDAKNNLRFNWRVMVLPATLIDYVVAHELCHVLHKNHSAEFWGLLGTVMPNYDERKAKLGKIGEGLDL